MAEPSQRYQGDTTWAFVVRFPVSWRPELRAAAQANGVAMADIVRTALRAFLSARLERTGG